MYRGMPKELRDRLDGASDDTIMDAILASFIILAHRAGTTVAEEAEFCLRAIRQADVLAPKIAAALAPLMEEMNEMMKERQN